MQCGVYRIWLGNCKTYRFEGVTLLTAFATRNLISLTLVGSLAFGEPQRNGKILGKNVF